MPTHVLATWEDAICDGWSDLPVNQGGYLDAAQQASDHLRLVLGTRYEEIGNLERIEVLNDAL